MIRYHYPQVAKIADADESSGLAPANHLAWDRTCILSPGGGGIRPAM